MKVGDKVKCEIEFQITAINEEYATVSAIAPLSVFEERGFTNLELVLDKMQILDGTKFQLLNKE